MRYYVLFILLLFTSFLNAQTSNKPDLSQSEFPGTYYLLPLPQAYNSNGTIDKFNYQRIWNVQKPETNSNAINETDEDIAVQATKYYDGFGDNIQTIHRSKIFWWKDVVEFVDHRINPQTNISFLPYAVDHQSKFRVNPYSEQRTFYQLNYPEDKGTSYRYIVNSVNSAYKYRTLYEAGKSNVGQIAQNAGGQVEVDNVEGPSIPILGIYGASTIKKYGNYSANSLIEKNRISNSVPIKEYYDLSGRLICSMINANNCAVLGSGCGSYWLVTYYLYNDLGQLIRKITPEGYAQFTALNWDIFNSTYSTIADRYCYVYEYDNKGRLIREKNPSKNGWDSYVYDNRDRLIFTQSPQLAQEGKWEFSMFDVYNRVIATGLYVPSVQLSRLDLQNNFANPPSVTSTQLFYYLTNYSLKQQDLYNVNFNDGTDVEVYNYYDDYFIAGLSGRNFLTAPFNAIMGNGDTYYNQYVDLRGRTTMSRGMLTGRRIKILKAPGSSLSSFTREIYYYDDRSRLIQKQVLNPYSSSEWDVVSYQYDYAGHLLRQLYTHQHQSSSTKPTLTLHFKSIYYNRTFDLLSSELNIDNSGWRLLKKDNYSMGTGDLNKTELGAGVEVQEYKYDQLGRLTSINENFVRGGSTYNAEKTSFGEILSYDHGFEHPQLFGKVAGIVWRERGSYPLKAYGYEYDGSGRLANATYYEYSQPLGASTVDWNHVDHDYTENYIDYDNNGNVKSLKRKGGALNISTGKLASSIDELVLSYDGNRVNGVTDNSTVNTSAIDYDYKNNNSNGSPDYKYDYSGNLTEDKDRQTVTTYNHFNKPVSITFTNYPGDYIYYSYDGVGNKIQEIYSNNGVVTTYDYWGDIVYKNNDLYRINNETGYVTQSAPDKYNYFFYAKDHLGNVRTILDGNDYPDENLNPNANQPAKKFIYPITFEPTEFATESSYTSVLSQVTDAKPLSIAPDDLNSAMLDANNPNRKVGALVMLKVMAGDSFSLSAQSYHQCPDYHQGDLLGTEEIFSALLTTLSGNTSGEGGMDNNNIQLLQNVFNSGGLAISYNNLKNSQVDPNKPKSFLNYLLFDEEMNLVPEESGIIQIKGGEAVWENVAANNGDPIYIGKGGYLVAYLSNEDKSVPAYWDNINLIHYQGKTKDQFHYYPYGVTINLSSSNQLYSRYLYQTKQIETTHGLHLYDFVARQYDPQIGRFLSVDPVHGVNTGFNGMANDPVTNIDPTGKSPTIIAGVVLGIVGAVVNVAVHYDRIYDGTMHWGNLAAAAGIGFASGFVTGVTAGTVSPGAVGFAAGFTAGAMGTMLGTPVMSVGNNIAFGDPIVKPDELAKEMLISGMTSGILYSIPAISQGKNPITGMPPKEQIPMMKPLPSKPLTVEPGFDETAVFVEKSVGQTPTASGIPVTQEPAYGTDMHANFSIGSNGLEKFDLKNPSSFEGALPGDVKSWLQSNGWNYESFTNQGGVRGFRFTNGNYGEQIRLMPGTSNLPADAAGIKGGPYLRISIQGLRTDPIPLFGNPILK